jgi:uncharacterized protein
MMITRSIQSELMTLLKEYKVVTITGPRQSGKTTLARMACPDYHYCNLEDPETRHLAVADPKGFFSIYQRPLIIDEIQRVPELVSWIQVMVDQDPAKGSFLLTGSEQLSLRRSVSQSLAGRTALLTLLPLSITELRESGLLVPRDELILKGFLPGVYSESQTPFKAYRNYFQTYIERDLVQLMNVRNIQQFENFVRLLAGRIGQVINLHSMSNDLGVSSTTLGEWLSVLEASWLVFRLPPYFTNQRKRIIKTPKIYFTEIGLVSYLLGLETPSQVARDPLIGGIFENMVVIEALKARLNQGRDPELYFYRDNNKNEMDLIYRHHQGLIPIEIKSSMTWHESLAKNLRFFGTTFDNSQKGYLVYAGDRTIESEGYHVIPYQNIDQVFNRSFSVGD